MADSAALRARRKRLHAAGNHSLCRDGRCESVSVPGERTAPAGAVHAAVLAFVSRHRFAEGDPRGVSQAVALRLAEVVDVEASPMAARELGLVCRSLADWSDLPGNGDFIDDLNARGHVKALEMVMASLQPRLPAS